MRIREAYGRFKAYVYYDNFNLTLRSQLAAYEKENLNEKLDILADELFDYKKTGKISSRVDQWIKDSGYIVLPKSFEDNSKKRNSILVPSPLKN